MKQILMQCRQGTCEIAVMENGHLVELFTEKPDDSEKAGNLYKGRIVNVVPGLQAAFVDIGLDKNAYLYLDDLLPAHLEKQPQEKPPIQSLVREGQTLIVQIKKESKGAKGAKVTTHVTLPGRWTVFLPEADYVAVSRKIEEDEERNRLKQIGEIVRKEEDGIILRTVATGIEEEVLQQDYLLLRQNWEELVSRSGSISAPSLLYSDLDFVPRLVRDLFTDEVNEWVVDGLEAGERVRMELAAMAPELTDRVTVYSEQEPLFSVYGIEAQKQTMFRRKLWLPSGGYIVVDPTEALTAIDVNTGKFTAERDLETTAFLTNLEAAVHIARLIRLRDLGGIILVDFIDMKEEDHKRKVEEALAEGVHPDRTRTHLVGWTRLQLYELTRQQSRPAAKERLETGCPSCGAKENIPV